MISRVITRLAATKIQVAIAGTIAAMRTLRFYILLLVATNAYAEGESRIQYLGNEGVAVFHGSTTLLFDPLFREDYGLYTLVPDSTRDALFSGSTPFENITAIFVSHHHGDHFDPADMLRLMAGQKSTKLYAPQQAIDAMQRVAGEDDGAIFDRSDSLDLSYSDDPRKIQSGNITVEAFPIPHSGWPTARTNIQNIAFRVTVDSVASVVHLGDADPNLLHFERHEHQWRHRQVDAALPPYWFFDSRDGNSILRDIIQPGKSIGVHVPSSFAERENVPEDLRDFDLFINPGEMRSWLIGH